VGLRGPPLRALITALAAAMAALALAAAPGPGAAYPALQPAVDDLLRTGVHVSPRALGEATEDARARLIEVRRALAGDRRDAYLAIVPGPVGAPGMTAYARNLYRAADLDAPLLVTTPGRGVSFWGIEPRPPVIEAIAASGAGREPNPVGRLAAAAEIAVPQRDPSDGVREVLILLLLAVLGAAWATAWGAHRTDRQGRMALTEARIHLRLWIDTLRAQAMALSNTHLAPQDLQDVARVLAMCASTLTGVHTARTVADVESLGPRVHSGFRTLERVRGRPGEPWDPFAGLCATDPAHGPALDRGGEGPPASLCRDCARAAEAGPPPWVRRVPVGPGSLPYTVLRDEPIIGVASGEGPGPARRAGTSRNRS
jgi:hypothetical protein